MQRYLTGSSIAQSRLSLLFNAVAKIPMQFFILFIGAMVFVFYLFIQPPVLFQHAELARIQPLTEFAPAPPGLSTRLRAPAPGRPGPGGRPPRPRFRRPRAPPSGGLPRRADSRWMPRALRAARLVERSGGEKGFSDTNYIFLSFVTRYLPVGIVGLVIAVIFAATMSASSGEINSLATVTVVDIYRRHFRRRRTDHHYLMASRWATLFWGVYAVAFAGWGKKLGSLIVAVNVVGSLFYGSLLGCFVLAFGFRRVRGTAAFIGMLAGEAAIFWTFFFARRLLPVVQRDRLRGGGGARPWPSRTWGLPPLPPPQVPRGQNSRRGHFSSVSATERRGGP